MRESGILYPISSLPTRYGIGGFSREAFEFIDFLKRAGQGYWQVLPFGPTGFGDSPYQSICSFAGNPYFISLEELISDGLLTWEECDSVDFGSDPERVDYGALYNNRPDVLRIAYGRFVKKLDEPVPEREDKTEEAPHESKEISNGDDFFAFKVKNADWLDDFALYMALKDANDGAAWTEWDEDLRDRNPRVLETARKEYAEDVDFYSFLQYEFQKQWDRVHAYARKNNVKIIGDLPFYAAPDSADTWAARDMFCCGQDGTPTEVAGTPPDAFSETGQLWGNPVYNWKNLKKSGYRWWFERIARNLDFYDVIRIDHFRGFDEYYAVPAGKETAEKGKWKKGPGMDFFVRLKKELGDVSIIAEDLGSQTPGVQKLLRDSGYPGMAVLQYAFDQSESSWYLPYNHKVNSVCYTGTHDNETTRAWIEHTSDHDRDFARRYINSLYTDYGQFTWDFIREAYRSPAKLCIVPIQDYLVKGDEARLNTPGTQGSNWQWRVLPNYLSDDLCRSIAALSSTYGRWPKVSETQEDEKS